MNIKEITVGTRLKMIEGGGEYIVKRISGDEIELEHTRLVAGMNIYMRDLPLMFEDVRP